MCCEYPGIDWYTGDKRIALAAVHHKSEAFKSLMDALASNDRNAQRQVTGLLGKIGPPAKAAIPALERLSKDPDRSLRDAAARSLGQIKEGRKDPR